MEKYPGFGHIVLKYEVRRMVKKSICGITVEVKAVNPPRKRDGYAVYIYSEMIAAYRKESVTVHGVAGWFVVDNAMGISACFSTRERIEECIVDTWMRTNPKHRAGTSEPASRRCWCRGSG